MSKKRVYLSPSDQTKNAYAYGNTTEAIQCRRIADALEAALKRCGFVVKNNKSSSMAERVAESNSWGADLHMPLHTNAYNGKVSGTRIFTYDTKGAGYQCAKKVFGYLSALTPGKSESISADAELYEVHRTTAPCVYVESEFHDVPDVAKWIVEHVSDIAEAICHGICDYFGQTYIAEKPKQPTYTLPVLRKGDKGVPVLILQKLLGMTGDGVFGSVTETKVKELQKKNGSKNPDGVVGAWTWPLVLKK